MSKRELVKREKTEGYSISFWKIMLLFMVNGFLQPPNGEITIHSLLILWQQTQEGYL